MKEKSKLQTAFTITYAVVFVALVVFSFYMGFAEHNSVYQARSIEPAEIVKDYTEKVVDDPSAPAGVRKEYSWILSDISSTKDFLAFYIIHHYAEVRIDGELVYSLTRNENNSFGVSPSSNWVFVPLGQDDNGREVQITLTPAYKDVMKRGVEFIIGSRSNVVLRQLRSDLPQLILSILCIAFGVALMVFQPFLSWRKKSVSHEMLYLGNFLFFVGVWRITDTRCSPLLFSSNPMALGYITIAALFICCVPLMLFMREHFTGRRRTVFLIAAFVGCINTLVALACQVLGIADLRETLTLCHIMLIFDMVVLAASLIYPDKQSKKSSLNSMALMLLVGALADMLSFYMNNSSSGAIFTVVALFVYTVARFVSELFNMNRNVYIDAQTGLFNRKRWNVLMESIAPNSENVGVIMLDLNRLKPVNDTMGHKMGDKMILGFADILRNTLAADCTICRWGGDEFTVLVSNADSDKMECYISEISEAVEAHNMSGEKPEIHFAVGYALSTDYPTLSGKDLMEKADEKMYHNKSEWYRKNVPDYHL